MARQYDDIPVQRRSLVEGKEMGHPNEEVIRDYLQAFNQGDLERVGDLLADDLVIHFPGRNPMAGEKRGKQEVMTFFRTMMDRAGVGSIPPDVHDVLANDDHAVALMTRRVAGIDASVAVVYHVRDGKITEIWPHERNQYAVDEALKAAAGQL